MPTCPRCQIVLEEGVRYCPVDGTPINPPTAHGDAPPLSEPPLSLPTAAAMPRAGAAAPQAPDAGQAEGDEPMLIGTLIDNRYRIMAPLGEGGIGAVFLAEHVQIRRKVAVKVLHPEMAANPEFQARFEREALAASKVTHPSCVQVLDYGSYAGRSYLVMELVQGQDLRDQLREGPLSLEEAIAITCQILGALNQIHTHGIIHRDLKPANIMICEPDQAGVRVKLLDFGLAKNLQPSEPGGSPLTQYGTVFGTPCYISPEQATATPADVRSDIYAVGVILYEMVCGRTPFVSDDPMELIQAHISLPPPAPRRLRREISPALEAVITQALQKSRTDRYQTAEAFAEALAQVPEASGEAQEKRPTRASAASDTEDSSVSPKRAATPQQRSPRRPLRRAALVLGALAGLALILGLVALGALSGEDRSASSPQQPVTSSGGAANGAAPSAAGQSVPAKARRARRQAAPPASTAVVEQEPPEVAKKSPPAAQTTQAPLPPVSSGVRRASTYLGRGWTEAAIKQARQAVKRNRRDPHARVVLGHAYYKKLWCSDALKEYSQALSLAPQLKSDRTLISYTIGCLGRRSTSGQAGRLLVNKIGAPARPLLEQAARDHGSTDIRRRATQLLGQLEGQDG